MSKTLCAAIGLFLIGAGLGYINKREELIRKDVAHDLTNENIELFMRAIS